MKLLYTLLAVAALAFAGQTSAHSDEYLDTIATPHGGQMRMAGAYHFELVVSADALTVYVTDHAGMPVATTGAAGTATVLAGGKRASVTLQPAGADQLRGSGQFILDPAMRVVLNITLPGQSAQQARFTPLARAVIPTTAHDDGGHHH
jgi:hypothetical protein